MTTDRARIGGGKRGEKENKAPAPKRTVTPGYTPQSGPTLPIPLTPHRVKETGFTPSFFLFLCSFSWFLFVHADSETPSRRGCDPNYSTERFGALSTWSSSCVSSVEKKKGKKFSRFFFFSSRRSSDYSATRPYYFGLRGIFRLFCPLLPIFVYLKGRRGSIPRGTCVQCHRDSDLIQRSLPYTFPHVLYTYRGQEISVWSDSATSV